MYEKIKDVCRRKGITISALEKDLGFGKGYLSKVDRHKPSADRVKLIADYLGVSVGEIYGDADNVYYMDEATRETAEEIHQRPGMRALFSAARELSDDKLQAVAAMIERLKETNPDA